jgi:hypothetical protein
VCRALLITVDTNTLLGATLPQEIKDKLFITSLENIEFGLLLETEARTMKWGWLFRTYVQWHAIAFLLSELCVRTKGEAVDRAWRALEASAGRWWLPLTDNVPQRKTHHGHLWKPLAKLLAKAKAAREHELALEQAIKSFGNGQFPSDPFDLKSFMSHQQSSQALDKMLQPFAPELGPIPRAEQPTWPSNPAQSKLQGVTTQKIHGMDMQRRLPDGPITGFSDGIQDLNSSGQTFGNIPGYDIDDAINNAVAGAPLNFPDYAQDATPIPTTAPSNPSQASQPLTTAQSYATKHPMTAANGYPTFGDRMLPNTNMDFGMDNNNNGIGVMGSANKAANGQEMGERTMMEDGDVDWTLWDDMVNQLGTDGYSANPTGIAGAGTMGMMHWF